ncbi:MAG TPA: methylmalonyl Co-A mutase-associated GTPase MeaB [Chloroflexota bacterium]|nr:methylmalonyl Co-A mutase-associated GTPase MeaB [Chloroflexota bacterium]
MTTHLQRTASADELASGLLAGDRLALTRLISAVEAGRDDAREAMRCLFAKTGKAHVVGVTGPPGCGKSTLTTRLALEYRAHGETVGIVAVDPTSPYTGGAILGDRVRMMELHGDPGVFMRSMATRGVMGGLARSTLDVVLLLDAFGKDVVIIETVGVGQDEVEIARAADTTLVVGVPNLGDDIQAIKAGILEIADILVVNKADVAGADRLVADLRTMLQLGPERGWPTPIQQTVAIEGTGVRELVEHIALHRAYLQESRTWHLRRADSARRQVRAIVEDRVQRRLEQLTTGADWESRFASIAAREEDPYSVAEEVLRQVAHDG